MKLLNISQSFQTLFLYFKKKNAKNLKETELYWLGS